MLRFAVLQFLLRFKNLIKGSIFVFLFLSLVTDLTKRRIKLN